MSDMTLSERLLLALCKPVDQPTEPAHKTVTTVAGALDLLERVYPDLTGLICGKRVVDFGCGAGLQSIALVKSYGCEVVAVDTNLETLKIARNNARQSDVDLDRLTFTDSIAEQDVGTFDVVISKDSFEHFPEPEETLKHMATLTHDDGCLLVTFGPPWWAPYGSHMHFFCPVPWVNLWFSERTIMRVRANYRHDGALRFQDVESGLNMMSIAKFERIVAASGLSDSRRQYDCVRGLNFLGKIPLLRELLINHVTTVLHKH